VRKRAPHPTYKQLKQIQFFIVKNQYTNKYTNERRRLKRVCNVWEYAPYPREVTIPDTMG